MRPSAKAGSRPQRRDRDSDAGFEGIGAFGHEVEHRLGRAVVAAHQALGDQAGSQRDGRGGLRVRDPLQLAEQDRAGLVRAVQLALHQRAEPGRQRPLGVVARREAAQRFPGRVAALDQLAADRAQLGDLQQQFQLAVLDSRRR